MDVKKLFEEKRQLGTEIRELNDLYNKEGREWTGEDEQKWERVNAAYDEKATALTDAQERQDRADRVAEVTAQDAEELYPKRKVAKRDATAPAGEPNEPAHILEERALSGWLRQANGVEPTAEERAAAEASGINIDRAGYGFKLGESRAANGRPMWLTGGGSRLTAESRAMSAGTATEGAETVPQGFVAELERAMVAYNGPRQVARILRTDAGNLLKWPTATDVANSGRQEAENAAVNATDFTTGEIDVSAFKQSSDVILVSQELLEDSGVNLASEVNAMLAERIGRGQNAAFTTGTGSGAPQGIVTGASAGVTAASATVIAPDEIKNLVHSVDPAYRGLPSVGFMMHDNVLLAVRKLKDGDNRYLWQDSIQLGQPDRLEGFPVTVNQAMASTIATTAVTMLFGAFEKFLIRDVRDVRLYRLEELYRANDQTGFVAFLRSDSRVLQAAAIKKLTQA